MPYVVKHRRPPEPWREFRKHARQSWTVPFFWTQWAGEQAAYFLGRWSFLELLEYFGSFSVLVAVVLYFAESGARRQQKHYQAWQVINTAQGKGGSGGRIDALEQLNEDHVPLVGVDVSGAFLQNVRLDSAQLRRASLGGADLRGAHLRRAELQDADLHTANLRGADLRSADLSRADFTGADLAGCTLSSAKLSGANLDHADLYNADLHDVREWKSIASVRMANLHGVKSAPAGFIEWAKKNGAVEIEKESD